ncbi:MAG: hypothetical protein KDK39_01455 [Leptospiraceae bacterium]|nr:hypothetical protein [Leptospiraceae bacterium]
MKWSLLDRITLQQTLVGTPVEHRLGPVEQAPYVMLRDSDQNETFLLLYPCQSGPPDTGAWPVLECSPADLLDRELWRQIQAWHKLNLWDLARFCLGQKRYAVADLMQAMGHQPNYKKIEEWQDYARLDQESCEFAGRYQFTIHTLRLWNRLERAQRESWRQIFTGRQIKKNLVREMIHDYYDLDSSTRQEALAAAHEFSLGWGDSKAVFPADQLRDLVRSFRSREYMQQLTLAANAKRALQLPRHIQLDLPADLELHAMELRIRFQSSAQLQESLTFLNQADWQDRLRALLQLL